MGAITPEEQRRIEPQVSALIQAAEREAERLVGVHWIAIGAVTQDLVRHESSTSAKVAEIVRANKPASDQDPRHPIR